MGQVCNLRAVWDDTIRRLLLRPREIHPFLSGEGRTSIEDGGETLCIDKAWHAIHFVCTGTEWEGELPWAFLIHEATPVGDEQYGCGPVMSFDSDQVSDIAEAFSSLPPEQFAARIRLDELARRDIYPRIWTAAENAEYLTQHYSALREFLVRSAARSKGTLVYYT